jgi:hypothetical protein
MTDPKSINLSQLQPGPIRNQVLAPELLGAIEGVFAMLGRYLGMTLEEFEVGFMRDLHPEREVALWCNIALAWSDYHKKYLNGVVQSDAEEKALLGTLVVISAGANDVGKFRVPAEVGRRLLQCYHGLDTEPPSEGSAAQGGL